MHPVSSFFLPGAIVIRILFLPPAAKNEFIDKLKGLSYAEIAAKGGGILNSADETK